MKRILLAVTVLALGIGVASAQEVKIKRGKATLTEEQYNALKAKADAYDQSQAELQAERQKNQRRMPQTFTDSVSYAIGRDMASQWKKQNLGLNLHFVAQALLDVSEGRVPWPDNITRPLLQRFQTAYELRQREGVQTNISNGQKYLEEISKTKGVQSTASGLRYLQVTPGNGRHPKMTDRVRVHYTGALIDGTVFDSSLERGEPITFALNQVIAGWSEGLQLMDEGSTYMLYIPYNLAYGEQQAGEIPPGSTLVFKVQLLEINPK